MSFSLCVAEYPFDGLEIAAGIGGKGVAESWDEVASGGESRPPENEGSKSSGGMLGGAETVERCVRNVPWLI